MQPVLPERLELRPHQVLWGARRDTCKMGHDAKFCKDTCSIGFIVVIG